MIPRLKSSTKWTNFPQEYLDQIKEVFTQTFEEQLKPKTQGDYQFPGGEFRVEGRIYPQEILLRVGFLERGRLAQANFETSIDFDPKTQNAVQSIHKCVDAIASMVLEYFQIQADPDAELDFPIQWTAYKFEGQEIFFQFTTINTHLESEADRILGLTEKKLFYEGEEDDAINDFESDADDNSETTEDN